MLAVRVATVPNRRASEGTNNAKTTNNDNKRTNTAGAATNCARCTCGSGTEHVANVLGLPQLGGQFLRLQSIRNWRSMSLVACHMLHVACCMPYMLLVVVDCNVVVRLHSDRKWRAVRSASAALPASKYRREDVFGQLPVRLQEGDARRVARHSRAELRSGETKGALLTGGSRARARRPSVRP